MTQPIIDAHAAPRSLRPLSRILMLVATALILWAILGLSPAHAQTPDKENKLEIGDLGRTIEESIKAEKAGLKKYRDQLKLAQQEKIFLTAAINGYQLRLSTYENLLLASGVDINSIEKAQTELRASITELENLIDEMAPRLEAIGAAKGNLGRQKDLIEKQILELQKIKAKSEPALALLNLARELSGILIEKEKLLVKLEQTISGRLDLITKLNESFLSLFTKLESSLEQRKSRRLFERRKSPITIGVLPLLEKEAMSLYERFQEVIKPEFWIAKGRELWQSAGLVLISLIIVFGVAFVLLRRVRRAVARIENNPVVERLGPWHLLMLRVTALSFVLGGVTLILYLYSRIDDLYVITPFLRFLTFILLTALVTRWAILFISLRPEKIALPPKTAALLLRLIKSVRRFCWFYLFIDFVLPGAQGFLIIARLVFEIWFLTWVFSFWNDDSISGLNVSDKTPSRGWILVNPAGKAICYLIAGAALLFEMIGYGSLAVHWLLSWGRSTMVIIWWTVFFLLIQEWDFYYREKRAVESDEYLHDEYPLQWLILRIGQIVWLVSMVVVIILAWGGQKAVLARIYEVLGWPLEIGAMKFSLLGLIYAALVLAAAHAVVRLWRWIFQNKYLTRSGLEVGLQDSITTITVYVIWFIGIITALHVFGLDTATLAVAFGALGIGLGFGLQNIFNNFISGIILLFERPIQVGDEVEVNGVWATVKKIQVRATVVQTYDNASLIIPNSEFVSSQVKNWSFKDKRLRREIIVGVAYGSDVNLARDTLLEIARDAPKVRNYPAPDVLFTDFGDSALIFKLRIWTDVESMLRVETAVRFEIDRLFRERGIEIAFPQRDIHIRSIVGGDKSEVMAGHKEEAD